MDSDEPVSLAADLTRVAWGGRAAVVSVAALAGDASSRRYFRVRLRNAGPATAVLMIQSGSGLSISSDELSSVSRVPAEMPFLNVQRYLHESGVAVPAVHAADSPRGIALLEDLGDTTLWDAVQGRSEQHVLGLFGAAIDELVRLQRAGALRPDPGCIAFGQRFDARLFRWEFDHFLEYGCGGRALGERDRSALRSRFEGLAEDLASGPAALTHRDYHSWNLFVQDGRIRVIDFQDALLAPVPYDLATLLNDRATPTVILPALEQALLRHFCERRRELCGEPVNEKEFRAAYFHFVFQKSLKIVGRFHYLEAVKGKRGYVAMLPHTFATLRRCFENLPELADLRALLAPRFPELA